MKFVFFVMATLFLVSTSAYGGEYKNNPDRFPSIGMSLGLFSGEGDRKLKAGILSASQDGATAGGDIALDTRIPVSDSVTFSGELSYWDSKTEFDQTPDLFGGEEDFSGFEIRIGARFYMN